MSLGNRFIFLLDYVGMLSFLGGGVLTLLKLISMATIVKSVPPESFPQVFLFATAYLYATEYLFSKIESRHPKLFIVFSFTSPLPILIMNGFLENQASLTFVTISYLLTISGISLLDAGLKHYQSQSLSLLSPDRERNRLLIAEEIGQLVVSGLMILSQGLMLKIAMAAILSGYLIKSLNSLELRTHFFNPETQQTEESDSTLERSLLLMLVLLVAIKLCYGILLYHAYKKLVVGGNNFDNIFLIFSILQSLASLWGLSRKSAQGSLGGWDKGLWAYLIPQVSLLSFTAIFYNPLLAIAAGSLRKTLNHAALNPSLLKLGQYLPPKYLLSNKRKVENLGHLVGIVFISLILVAQIYFHSNWVIPGSIAFLCLLACASLVITRGKLSQYFTNQLKSPRVSQVLGAILGLSSTVTRPIKEEFLRLLKGTQSQHVKVLIIRLLSRWQERDTEEAILEEYNKTTREDVRSACIESLAKTGNQKIQESFFQELELISFELESKEAFRWKLYQKICLINPEKAIQKLLMILESEEGETTTRGQSNLIFLLGEVAKFNKANLESDLKKYTLPDLPRRIRVNALISILKTGNAKDSYQALLDELKNSSDSMDKLAWAYAQGELNHQESIDEIYLMSQSFSHAKMTCHIALLKLGDAKSAKMSAELYQILGEEKRLEFIHQLSRVHIQKHRLAFYDALLKQNPDLATDLMEKMTYSKKDFDDDLGLLLFTLREKGIEMGKLKIKRFAHYS
jgi:hypothetical protein